MYHYADQPSRQILVRPLIILFWLFSILLINGQLTNWRLSGTTPVKASSQATASISEQPTYIVALDSSLSEEERGTLLQQFDAEVVHWIPELNLAEVRILPSSDSRDAPPANRGSSRARTMSASAAPIVGHATAEQIAAHTASMVAALSTNAAVEFIEENAVVHGTLANETSVANPPPANISTEGPALFAPDDPELKDTTNGYAQQLLQMEGAWGYTQGSSNVIIAVLDTGVDTQHPELSGQFVAGYDFVNEDSDPMDDHGHGTHVAGIIGSHINNSQGSAGICPSCRLMPVKVLDENNVGVWSVIVQGLVYASNNGAQVINLSLGSAEESSSVHRAVQYAQEKGALLVAAAGNSRSKKLFYPAAYSGVLSVAATDNEDREWGLSNHGTYIDIAAPGYLIFSTSINNEQYSYMTGTSMAAPFVSGLAGLLLSKAPTSTSNELTDHIIQNAVDLGVPGWDSTFGFGRINAFASLASVAGTEVPFLESERSTIVFVPLINQ